jgi:hypothetical protein
MLVPCRKILAKKLLWVHIFRLNQHTTIKYCNAAILLGDGGGAVAIWEVCWAAVEGCSGGFRRQRRRKMWRDVTARQDSLQRWDIMHQQDAMTRRDDEMQRNGKTHKGTQHRQYSTRLHNNQPNKTGATRGKDAKQLQDNTRHNDERWWQDKTRQQDAGGRDKRMWHDAVMRQHNNKPKYLHMCRVLFYVGHDMHVEPKLATFQHVADTLLTCCWHFQLSCWDIQIVMSFMINYKVTWWLFLMYCSASLFLNTDVTFFWYEYLRM